MPTKIKKSYEDVRQEAKELLIELKKTNPETKLTQAQTIVANSYGYKNLGLLRSVADKNGGFIEVSKKDEPLKSKPTFFGYDKSQKFYNMSLSGMSSNLKHLEDSLADKKVITFDAPQEIDIENISIRSLPVVLSEQSTDDLREPISQAVKDMFPTMFNKEQPVVDFKEYLESKGVELITITPNGVRSTTKANKAFHKVTQHYEDLEKMQDNTGLKFVLKSTNESIAGAGGKGKSVDESKIAKLSHHMQNENLVDLKELINQGAKSKSLKEYRIWLEEFKKRCSNPVVLRRGRIEKFYWFNEEIKDYYYKYIYEEDNSEKVYAMVLTFIHDELDRDKEVKMLLEEFKCKEVFMPKRFVKKDELDTIAFFKNYLPKEDITIEYTTFVKMNGYHLEIANVNNQFYFVNSRSNIMTQLSYNCKLTAKNLFYLFTSYEDCKNALETELIGYQGLFK